RPRDRRAPDRRVPRGAGRLRRPLRRDPPRQADPRGLLPQARPPDRRRRRGRGRGERRERGGGDGPPADARGREGPGRGDRPMRPHRINAVIWRHLYLFPRTLERWSESIYWPVLDLIVWGLTSRWVETAGSDVPHMALIVLTGVVFWQVVWRANYEISVNLL